MTDYKHYKYINNTTAAKGVLVEIWTVCIPLGSSAVAPGLPQDQRRQNGSLDGQPAGKRRRGRRKNVEGMDPLFMNRNQVAATPDHHVSSTRTHAHTLDLISSQPRSCDGSIL